MNKNRKDIKYIINKDGCWICTTHKSSKKDNSVSINRKDFKGRLYRLMYEKKYGVIPEGLICRHICHNRECINPDHILLGTNKDNTIDMMIADRCGKNKLMKEQVLDIYNSNLKYKNLSKKYNISVQAICDIKHGRRWAWLTGGKENIDRRIIGRSKLNKFQTRIIKRCLELKVSQIYLGNIFKVNRKTIAAVNNKDYNYLEV